MHAIHRGPYGPSFLVSSSERNAVPKRWRQIRIGTLLLSVAVGTPLLGSKLDDLLIFARAGTAYSAKVLCSSV